jgi:hypothetical protein
VESLSTDKFLNLIVSSSKAAEVTLNTHSLCKRLCQFEKTIHDNHLDLIPQTFPKSCTACAVLYALKKKGLITHYERSTELEIYKEIWSKPGDIADPRKLIDYLKRRGLQVVGIDLKERSNNWLEKAKNLSGSAYTQFLGGYTLFKEATQNLQVKTIKSDIVFKPGDLTLLVLAYAGGTILHTVIGMQTAEDTFQVIDTENG